MLIITTKTKIMRINKIIKAFLPIAILSVMIAACNKDKDKLTGPPTVTRVRANLPAPSDSTLSKAGPGQWIVIEGGNLAATSQLYFNGWPATFNNGLFSNNSMVVLIPSDMPFASLDQSKLNSIRIVNPSGETTYTFAIEPPPPIITAMSNEMAVAGDQVTIYGNNFFFITKVVFPGNVEVTTGITTNASGTELNLTIPAGITSAGTIKVINRYGTGTSILLFNDVETGVLCNFDNVNTINNWAGVTISNSATDFPGNSGTYARLTYSNIAAGDGTWWCCGRSINCDDAKQWVPVANLNEATSNFALKFEINTKVPWKHGAMILDRSFSFNYQGKYEGWNTAAGNIEYTSNGWKTVVIPLSNFKNNSGNGSPAPSLTALLGAAGNGGFNLFFLNTSSAAITTFDAAVDNFRVVRVSN
jgi:Surface glycan-binding protein B xyloglucan binding domain